MINKIFHYAQNYPLLFLGCVCWFASPIIIGLLGVLFDVRFTGWFWPFIFFLGIIFFLLHAKYESEAARKNRD